MSLNLSVLPTERKVTSTESQWLNPLGNGSAIRLPIGSGQSNGIGSEEFYNCNQLKCGIDLVCSPQLSVYAVESGTVISLETFFNNKRKPWISPSMAFLVSGKSGIVCYGNINPNTEVKIGTKVCAGDKLGTVVPFFSKPTKANCGISRLRIELYKHGTIKRPVWHVSSHQCPKNLLNPIPKLLPLITSVTTVRKRSSKLA